jgi:lysophospholipase L1-like esterase
MDLRNVFIATGIVVGIYLATKLTKINPKGKRVLVIGDSHSAGKGWGWQDTLSWKYGFELDNLAVAGKSTPWMLETLTNYYKNKKEADIVFIYGGANDAFSNTSIETSVGNIQKMVDIVNANGGKAIVVVGFNYEKAVKPNVTDNYYSGISKYMKLQDAIQKDIDNATIVKRWEDVNNKSVGGDGFHLPKSSQTLFADYIAKEVLI